MSLHVPSSLPGAMGGFSKSMGPVGKPSAVPAKSVVKPQGGDSPADIQGHNVPEQPKSSWGDKLGMAANGAMVIGGVAPMIQDMLPHKKQEGEGAPGGAQGAPGSPGDSDKRVQDMKDQVMQFYTDHLPTIQW